MKAEKGGAKTERRKSNHPGEEGQLINGWRITKGRRRGCGNTIRSAVAIRGPNQVKIFVGLALDGSAPGVVLLRFVIGLVTTASPTENFYLYFYP